MKFQLSNDQSTRNSNKVPLCVRYNHQEEISDTWKVEKLWTYVRIGFLCPFSYSLPLKGNKFVISMNFYAIQYATLCSIFMYCYACDEEIHNIAPSQELEGNAFGLVW